MSYHLRAEQMRRSKNCKSHVPTILTYMLTIIFMGILFMLAYFPIPEINKNIVYMLSGSFTTAYLTCMTYWFGTTFSSSNYNLPNSTQSNQDAQ